MATKDTEHFSHDEAQRRFEAALRGAREVGHEPMKDIPPKRPHSATKIGKRKTKMGKSSNPKKKTPPELS